MFVNLAVAGVQRALYTDTKHNIFSKHRHLHHHMNANEGTFFSIAVIFRFSTEWPEPLKGTPITLIKTAKATSSIQYHHPVVLHGNSVKSKIPYTVNTVLLDQTILFLG
jgi:hypothetical protein